VNRRHFILQSSSTIAAATVPLFSPFNASALVNTDLSAGTKKIKEAQLYPEISTDRTIKHFSHNDWLTLTIVQNHFLPSENDAPGAVEINALHYLYDFLSRPATDPVDVKFILWGTQQLQTLSKDNNTVRFIDQSIEHREKTLRHFEQQTEGRRWLVTIMNYVLEALLSDPVYGGNPDGIGWQWLEHRAGEPRPPMNKRYWLA